MHLSPRFSTLLSTTLCAVQLVDVAALPTHQKAFKLPAEVQPLIKREPHYVSIPFHTHHHEHGISIFVGHHHDHRHSKTVVVTRDHSGKNVLLDVDAAAAVNLASIPVAKVDLDAEVELSPIKSKVDADIGLLRRNRHFRPRHYEDEEVYFEEESESDPVIVVDDDDDHYHHHDEDDYIEVARRGLLDGLLGAVLGVIDIVSPDLGKTLDGILKPILGSLPGLLLKVEPNSANQYAMMASQTVKSNVFLVYDHAAAPLADGSKVVSLQIPMLDEASQSMRTYCATFSMSSDAPSPLTAAECSKANEASQRFGYHLDTGALTPLRWVDPSADSSSKRASGMPCYDTVSSMDVPANATAQTITLKFTPETDSPVAVIKSTSKPTAASALDEPSTTTTMDPLSTETTTSTIPSDPSLETPALDVPVVQDVEDGVDLGGDETIPSTTDDASLPEQTPADGSVEEPVLEEPAPEEPVPVDAASLSAAFSTGGSVAGSYVMGFRPSDSAPIKIGSVA